MIVQNESYGFLPPGGTSPIRVMGAQEYAPGRPKKSDIWLIAVPDEYADKLAALPPRHRYGSYAEVVRALAAAFFGGDESKVHLVK